KDKETRRQGAVKMADNLSDDLRDNSYVAPSVIHGTLSFKIVGCAQRVHSKLGPGFPEGVYQKALCVELAKKGIPFVCEKLAEVHYDGVLCGEFRMDLVVDDKIVLELKALDAIHPTHTAQALSYLKATGLKLAIILNFGQERLKSERVVR
ncbi:MAG: GxxExxY protein, partial [Planctomycetaceae bacterium]|nr:GxxExxY protein [Planctomycetaceae bacterium]